LIERASNSIGVKPINPTQIRSIDGLTIRNLLSKIETPVQIIAGARDPVVTPVNAEYLDERLHHQCATLHLGRRGPDPRDAGHELVGRRLNESRLASVAGR
jgi:hypothetical protein